MSENKNTKLSKCDACDGVISKSATVCPHCGQKKPNKSKSRSGWYGLVVIIILMFFYGLGQANRPDNDTATDKTSSAPNAKQVQELCIKAIRASVNNPSTLDIHRVMGYASKLDEKGNTVVVQTFSAKNSFGLEKTYDALCTLTAKGKFEFLTREQANQ